jgi:hypothetical protein
MSEGVAAIVTMVLLWVFLSVGSASLSAPSGAERSTAAHFGQIALGPHRLDEDSAWLNP